jgi:cytoskeletal protein RodZ
MRTRTIGEVLQEQRAAHHISLEQLAKKTRIRAEYLDALENNQFAKLPAAAFVKGYIKTYAQAFGFEHESLLAMLRRDYKESVKGTLVPREFLKPVLKKRRSVTSITIFMMVLGGFFLSLISYVAIQWYNLQKPPFLEVVQPADQAQVAARVIIEGNTDPEALVTVNEQPVAMQPDGSFTSELVLPTQGITTITVVSTDARGKINRQQRTVYVRF